jgi:hypothetical protein
MQPIIERGTVIADREDDLLVVWESLRDGAWLGMPLHRQTGPLHRSHLLVPPEQAWELLGYRAPKRAVLIIDTASRRVIDAHAQIIGWLGSDLIALVEATYQRARMASQYERANFVRMPSWSAHA